MAMLGLSLGNPNDTDVISNIPQAGIGDFINVKGWHNNSDQEKRAVINAASACLGKTRE